MAETHHVSPLKVLLLLPVVCLAALADAGVDAGADEFRNAATWYQRAVDAQQRLVSAEDMELVREYLDHPHRAPPDGLRQVISRASAALNAVRRGSRQEYSDFGLDYSQGFELTLPHLAQLRDLARVMSARAQLALHDGETASAASEVATMYRMSVHLGDDGTMISSLVGRAVFNLAEETVSSGFDRGLFNAADGGALLQGLDALAGDDPFQFVEALAMEHAIVVDYVVEQFGSQETRVANRQKLGWLTLMLDGTEDSEKYDAFVALTDEEFQVELDHYSAMMDEAVSIFMADDPDQMTADFEAFEARFEAGEFGLIAALMKPATDTIHAQLLSSIAARDTRRAMLEKIVTGVVAPDETSNAALFYRQAMERLDAADAADYEALLDPDSNTDDWTDERRGLDAALLPILAEAAERKRCTLALIRDEGASPICPPDLPRLRALAQFLMAGAERSRRGGDGAEATKRLRLVLRLVDHLGSDPPIVTALLAHGIFVQAADAIDGLLQHGADGLDTTVLLDAAERISRKDPFGYLGSFAAARSAMEARVQRSGLAQARGTRAFTEAIEAVGSWNGDAHLQMQIVFATLERAAHAEDAEAGANDLDHSPPWQQAIMALDELVATITVERAIERAVQVAPLTAPRIAAGEYDLFAQELPLDFRVEARHRTARRDLRRLLNDLRHVVRSVTFQAGDDLAR